MSISAPRGIVFDLDGTLLDTLASLADAFNQALQTMGHQTHDIDAYRQIIGDGALVAAQRALPQSHRNDADIQQCVQLFRKTYDQSWQTAIIYEGITELLDHLHDIPLAVLSNKDDQFTQQCVEHFFPAKFQLAVGASETIKHKPDSSGVHHIANALNVKPTELWMVGDTATDMKTAKLSGMTGIGVLWGFRDRDELANNGASHIIDTPAEVLNLINN